MSRMNKYIALGITLIIILIYCTCSINVAGGSSDHGNANVLGTIYDTLVMGVADVSLRLLPEDYNPAKPDVALDSLTAITDSTGAYAFYDVAPGTYYLIGVDCYNELRLFKKPVIVDTLVTDSVNAVLYKPGQIIIPINYNIIPGSKRVIMYIPGTTIFTEIQSNIKTIQIDSVPMGRYTLIGYIPSSGIVINFEREYTNFYVMSGGIADFTIRPTKPRGPKNASINSDCVFNTYCANWDTHPNVVVEQLEYRFSWGDADTSDWSPNLSAMHSWMQAGNYEIRVHMRCQADNTTSENFRDDKEKIPFYSGWSDSTIISIQ